jgi:hypothetical protein
VTARPEPACPRGRAGSFAIRPQAQLLSRDDGDGYLIFQLVVDGMDPALVARERGVSRPVLVEMLRDAVDELAVAYEDTAYAHLNASPAEQVRATLARKRG